MKFTLGTLVTYNTLVSEVKYINNQFQRDNRYLRLEIVGPNKYNITLLSNETNEVDEYLIDSENAETVYTFLRGYLMMWVRILEHEKKELHCP